MAEPLKVFFDVRVVESIARDLVRAGVDVDGFVTEATTGLAALELLDRGRHIARAMRRVLPSDGKAALDTLVRSFGPEVDGSGGMSSFRYLPHVVLIGELGVDHPDEGLLACHAVTRRFTAEWCVRPILDAHPERTFAALALWVEDPNEHVRRLVSEGLRPRLPWAPRVARLADPHPGLALLERLVDDPSEYVRRSVANHLNDIAKDHPDLAVDVARRWWIDAPEPRRRLVRHALRHLVKQGHPGALAVQGFAGAAVRVEQFVIPETARIGETVRYTFELVSEADVAQELVVDAVVGYRKARGKVGPKVFKLRTVTLRPGERIVLAGRVPLEVRTTRKPLPGLHTVDVQVNGQRYTGGGVDVRE